MNLNSFLLFLIIIFCFSSCNSVKRTVQPITENTELTIDYLEGYFLKNTVEFEEEKKHLIISSQENFDTYFGIAKTMNNTISEIDFKNYNAVAILLKESKMSQALSVKSILSNKNVLNVYYETAIMEEQTYSSIAMRLFKIPKSFKTIKFISEKTSETLTIDSKQ